MSLSADETRSLLAAFESSRWMELTVEVGGDRLHVSRRPDASVHPMNEAVPSPPTTEEVPVRSPSIGRFRRAASPGAPAAAEVGSAIEAGDPVGFVEIMDRLAPVPASAGGTVTALLADDGATVEYGERVALIAPGEGELHGHD